MNECHDIYRFIQDGDVAKMFLSRFYKHDSQNLPRGKDREWAAMCVFYPYPALKDSGESSGADKNKREKKADDVQREREAATMHIRDSESRHYFGHKDSGQVTDHSCDIHSYDSPYSPNNPHHPDNMRHLPSGKLASLPMDITPKYPCL